MKEDIDYYNVLGISKNATMQQIKKAYHKKAMQYHPDKNPTNKAEAENKFKELNEAYSVLSDETKKKVYDTMGKDGLKMDNESPFSDIFGAFTNPGKGSGKGSGKGPVFTQFFMDPRSSPFSSPFSSPKNTEKFHTGDPDMFHPGLFGMPPFSPLGNPFNSGPRAPTKGPSTEYPLQFTLEDLFRGRKKTLKITRSVGFTKKPVEVVIDIPMGCLPGTRITLPNHGDELPGMSPGDIIFVIGELPHKKFRRNGNNLCYTHTITLDQALKGTVIEFKGISDKDGTISKRIEPLSHSKYVYTIKGKGMTIPGSSERGDLLVDFHVNFK